MKWKDANFVILGWVACYEVVQYAKIKMDHLSSEEIIVLVDQISSNREIFKMFGK